MAARQSRCSIRRTDHKGRIQIMPAGTDIANRSVSAASRSWTQINSLKDNIARTCAGSRPRCAGGRGEERTASPSYSRRSRPPIAGLFITAPLRPNPGSLRGSLRYG